MDEPREDRGGSAAFDAREEVRAGARPMEHACMAGFPPDRINLAGRVRRERLDDVRGCRVAGLIATFARDAIA